MKACNECKMVKPYSEFYKMRSGNHRGVCKQCMAVRNRKWFLDNVERARKSYARTYYRKKERLTRRSAAEQQAERDKQAARCKRYRERHKERLKAERQANIEKYREQKRRDRAERRRRGAGKVTKEEWVGVVAEANCQCFYCGAAVEKVTIDHVIPLSKGGRNLWMNLIGACMACNGSKSSRDPIEWVFLKFGADALARLFLLMDRRLHGEPSGN